MKTSYICNQNPTHYEKVTPYICPPLDNFC